MHYALRAWVLLGRRCGPSAGPGLAASTSSCRWLSSLDQQNEPPAPFHLDHVSRRLTDTVPTYPKHRLDYTFYRRDVVMEDRIWNQRRNDRDGLMQYWGLVSVALKMLLPHVEFEVVSIATIVTDGTVRLRWRCKYVSFPRLFTNPKLFRFDYRLKNLSWYDGYCVFRVDGNGDVFHVVISKVMDDEERLKLATGNSPTRKAMEKLGLLQSENVSTSSPPPSPAKQNQH